MVFIFKCIDINLFFQTKIVLFPKCFYEHIRITILRIFKKTEIEKAWRLSILSTITIFIEAFLTKRKI